MDCPKCQTTIQDHEVKTSVIEDAIEVSFTCGSCNKKFFGFIDEVDFIED